MSTRKSKFSKHILNAGYEMQPMVETMITLHFEVDPKRNNALEEIEIMKAITSDHMLNAIQNNNPLYKILQTLQEQNATGTRQLLRMPL